MSIRPSFDNIDTWLAAKPAGHFVIERWGVGFAVNIHRVGEPVETILAKSPGEARQLGQKLTDEGLCGYVSAGA